MPVSSYSHLELSLAAEKRALQRRLDTMTTPVVPAPPAAESAEALTAVKEALELAAREAAHQHMTVDATYKHMAFAALRATPTRDADAPEVRHPEPPWPIGATANSKREGWAAFFAGRSREKCPFPSARRDLLKGYQEGWDAAALLASGSAQS